MEPVKSSRSRRYDFELKTLAITFIVSSTLFALLAAVVTNGITNSFDETVLLWINQHASPAFDAFFVAVTQLGGVLVVTVISLLIVAYLLVKREYVRALFVVVGMGGAALLNVILKASFERARPDLWEWVITETSLSFPSGHATASMALGLIIVVLLWRTKWRLYALIGATLYVLIIGLSRLYLGVHYPTDILGGWLLSLTWISFVALGCLLIVQARNGRAA